VSTGATPHSGDLGRRVAERRRVLGKSLEEVAEEAGVDAGYLRYVEENASARLSSGTLFLVARALDCTPEDLHGGDIDRPPGHGRAGNHPELRALTHEQCQAHLRAGGVGRLVFVSDRGPVAHPVNYAADGRDVVVSTTVDQADLLERAGQVSFQIDRVDEAMSEGWSVLVTGAARRVDDPDELLELARLGLEPWAGGNRHALVRIRPEETTGRLVAQGAPPGPATTHSPG
jgi:transcriptional regulator with XRE-family HTH domain